MTSETEQPDESGYFYPGTTVLRNKRGFTDRMALREFELDLSQARLAQLISVGGVDGAFDLDHALALHRHLLGDVFDWAGELRREGGLSKLGPSPESIRAGEYDAFDVHEYHYLVAGESMRRFADEALSRLPTVKEGGAMTTTEFARAIASPWGDFNLAHVFREGNTRSQIAFFTLFAQSCGHRFDFECFRGQPTVRSKFNAARFLFQETADSSLLVETLCQVVRR